MFGELSTSAILFLAGAVTAILLFLGWIALRNPVLTKLGLRNLVRRPGQSALIVIGLTLSTIIIISSLGTGDTLRYSVQRQAVDAYGKVDEIIAPPLLSMFAGMANSNADDTQAQELQQTMENLTKGGLDSVLALVGGGLPSISSERLNRLKAAAANEPLIDGVAGSIVFPTILRNVRTGQSEPIGFIFAVDDDYDQSFGLTTVEGAPLNMEDLQPGVGNILVRASQLFGVIGELNSQIAALQSGQPLDQVPVTTQLVAVAGALLTGATLDELPPVTFDVAELEQLGIDSSALREEGIESITLQDLAAQLQATEEMTGTVTSSAGLAGPSVLTGTVPALAMDNLAQFAPQAEQFLRAINLNTIGYDLDRLLGQYGLQLRQGDVYLNRMGAEQLGATPGDVLEIYIGPVPVRYRVRAVVDQAGPLSALTPVVMLRLDEAQQLLFMSDRVNSVLVSNVGDDLASIEPTAAVSRRLRVLSLDDDAVDRIKSVLSRPAVREILGAAVAELPESVASMAEEDGVPPLVAEFFTSLLSSFNIEMLTRAQGEQFLAAIDSGSDAEFREFLAGIVIQQWLLELTLPEDAARELATAVSQLNQFEQIEPLNKASIVAAADIGGGIFASIFSIFGIFSILAGLLLIVLIIVMLAAERRVEIGVSRAIGVQRHHVVQMFVTEGMVYNLAAAALGVILGIAITFAMTRFIGQLFNDITGQINTQAAGIFSVRFNISWQSVIIAYCSGVLLTWATMTFASWRVSRMNIVTAIRDLPDEAAAKRRSLFANIVSWLYPAAVLGLGGYLLVQAAGGSLSILMIGATVTLYGAMALLGRILELTPIRNETGYRLVYTILGAGLLAIWVPQWFNILPQWLPGMFEWDPTQAPTVFTVGGPMIITGAILVIMFNADLLAVMLAALLGFLPSLRPVLKTAIAYPLSTRFRTGMTMLLFAMIMATVVVMAVIINTTQTLTRLDPRQTAGFDIEVSPTLLSFFSPVEDFAAGLAGHTESSELKQIERVGLITNQQLDIRVAGGGHAYGYTNMAALNQDYLDQAATIYSFQARAPGFTDDASVWAAIAARDDAVVISPGLLEAPLFEEGPEGDDTEGNFGLPADRAIAPSTAVLSDLAVTDGQLPELYLDLRTTAADGVERTHRVQVVGLLSNETTLAEAPLQASEATLRHVRSAPVKGDRIFLKVADGAGVKEVAAAVEQAFVASGFNTTVLAESFAQRQRLTSGILQLLQGFMALGLLVGIAALGIISIRSVLERRQQIGMLRALGYQRNMVSLSFMLESSFVSITGLLIGALTGLVLGGNIALAFFPQLDEFGLSTPWLQIGLIVLFAYLFSLAAAVFPAWQATRIYPAEALRYE